MTETNLIDLLPGTRMPVSDVTRELSEMQMPQSVGTAGSGQDFRASQLNLVLHFGLSTTADEALACFNTACEFGKVHPCRIIVLCPMGKDLDDRLLDAKLFAQCYTGPDLRNQCCIEALMLGYPTRETEYLTGQIANWLEGDLPTYYWIHRVPSRWINSGNLGFIDRCRRVIIDSLIDPYIRKETNWSNPQRVSDLSYARSLSLRQSIGQLLSSIPPADLVTGLSRVTIAHESSCAFQAEMLSEWIQGRLDACSHFSGAPAHFILETRPLAAAEMRDLRAEETDDKPSRFMMRWMYAGKASGNFLDWHMNLATGKGSVRSKFDRRENAITVVCHRQSPASALSEAVFF